MRNIFIRRLKSIINTFDYRELILNIGFVKDLLFLRRKMNINPMTILDVGASIGRWAKAARFVFPKSTIFAFEPIPNSFKKLASSNISGEIKYFNFALSSENKFTRFYLNQYNDSSSLLEMTDEHIKNFPFTKESEEINIECKRLDSLDNINLERPVFMKIDVQGAELDMLHGSQKLMDKIDYIQLELNFENFYKGQADYAEIFLFMKQNGFKYFIQRGNIIAKDTSRILFCDIIFFK